MSRLPLILITCLTTLLAISTACSNDSCYENGSSLPLASIYLGDKQQSVSGLTIMGIGALGDSLLADSTTLSEIYLPLRANATTTSYAVTRWAYLNNAAVAFHDTITIAYRPVEFFHSIECGAMYNFDISKVTTTTAAIDSVVLVTPLVTNAITPALRIYFTDFQP
jgi:hypothetical protein